MTLTGDENSRYLSLNFNKENKMGKYALGWFLGVPVFVLVIIYFFMH